VTDPRRDQLAESLDAYGADFSRWPAERVQDARRALLARPDFRGAFDAARVLDRGIANGRDDLDRTVDDSGASARVVRRVLARVAPDPLAGLRWQRIAAAILVAGMLGGALDLVMPEPADPLDLVMLDPLSAEDTELQ
jgi:hypothetical protein